MPRTLHRNVAIFEQVRNLTEISCPFKNLKRGSKGYRVDTQTHRPTNGRRTRYDIPQSTDNKIVAVLVIVGLYVILLHAQRQRIKVVCFQ